MFDVRSNYSSVWSKYPEKKIIRLDDLINAYLIEINISLSQTNMFLILINIDFFEIYTFVGSEH